MIFDCLKLALGAIAELARESAIRMSDREALSRISQGTRSWVAPVAWDCIRDALRMKRVSKHGRAAARSLLAGSNWTQSRLFSHGFTPSAFCYRCGAMEGTLLHRFLQCEALMEKRRRELPDMLKQGLRRVESFGPGASDMFCRLLLPHPGILALVEHACAWLAPWQPVCRR